MPPVRAKYLSFLFLAAPLACLRAAPSQEDAEKHFAQKVLPLLKEKCLACHGDDDKKIKGKFDMRTAASFRRRCGGGTWGRA